MSLMKILLRVFEKYRDIKEEVGKALVDLEKELGAGDERFDFDAQENKLKADKFSEDAPIIKMVAVILRHAVDGELLIFILNQKKNK